MPLLDCAQARQSSKHPSNMQHLTVSRRQQLIGELLPGYYFDSSTGAVPETSKT
jgi:hypothetical protein